MTRARDAADGGFGLVEVIIALGILGLLAIAVLPMIITGLRVAGEQSTVATATQLVSSTIDHARSDPSASCEELRSITEHADARGAEIRVVGAVVPDSVTETDIRAGGYDLETVPNPRCPGFTTPGALKYIAVATNTSTGAILASATTIIFMPDLGSP